MYFPRHFGPRHFHMTNDGSGVRVCLQTETDASPPRGSMFDPDFFPRNHPLSRHSLSEIQAIFVRILKDKHPAYQQWNGLLCWNTISSGVASDAGHFTSRPTPTGVGMVAMGIEEQQELLDAVES